jgi:tetratricopeptide (TPR) repeat protein
LYALGYLLYFEGDYDRSRLFHEQGLAIARELGDKRLIRLILSALGGVLPNLGEYDTAREYFEEILPVVKDEGLKWSIVNTLSALGDIARAQGDFEAAARYHNEALDAARESGVSLAIIFTACNTGNVALSLGELENARALFTESLGLALEAEDLRWVACDLDGLAGVAGASGQPGFAARLFSAAEALRESLGAGIEFADAIDRNRNLTAARAKLDDAEWQAAWAEGQAMSLEQVVELSLQPVPGPE